MSDQQINSAFDGLDSDYFGFYLYATSRLSMPPPVTVTRSYGDMYGLSGLAVSGNEPGFPDNYMEFTQTYTISVSATTYNGASLHSMPGHGGGDPSIFIAPSTDTCLELGHTCDTTMQQYPGIAASLDGTFAAAGYLDYPEDLGRGGFESAPTGACGRVTWTWGNLSSSTVSPNISALVGMDWELGNDVSVFIRYPGSTADYSPLISDDPFLMKNPAGDAVVPGGFVGLQTMRRWQEGGTFQLPGEWDEMTSYDFEVLPKPTNIYTWFEAGDIEFFCVKLIETEGYETGYIRYGSSEPAAVIPAPSSCEGTLIGRPALMNGDGTGNVVVLAPPDGSGWITLEQYDPTTDTWVVLLDEYTFPAGGAYDPTIVVPGYGVTSPGDLVFRCTDETGTFDTGYYAGGEEYVGIISGGEGGCFGGSGIGLNPGTWVPALVKIGGCHFGNLVVPDADAIGDSWDETYEEVSTAVPFAWVFSAHSLAVDGTDGLTTAIDAAASDCLVWIDDGMAGTSLTDSERGVCPHELASAGGPMMSVATFRDLLGKAIWLFWVLALGRVILAGPPAPEVVEEDNGQQAWNF
jgi:hypothetical protein